MSITTDINKILSTADVAEFYIGEPKKTDTISKWYCCPFHNEKTASLRIFCDIGKGYYCFGCGAGGGTVNFVQRLFNISNKDACIKINNDFNLNIFDKSKKLSKQQINLHKFNKLKLYYIVKFLEKYKLYYFNSKINQFKNSNYINILNKLKIAKDCKNCDTKKINLLCDFCINLNHKFFKNLVVYDLITNLKIDILEYQILYNIL